MNPEIATPSPKESASEEISTHTAALGNEQGDAHTPDIATEQTDTTDDDAEIQVAQSVLPATLPQAEPEKTILDVPIVQPIAKVTLPEVQDQPLLPELPTEAPVTTPAENEAPPVCPTVPVSLPIADLKSPPDFKLRTAPKGKKAAKPDYRRPEGTLHDPIKVGWNPGSSHLHEAILDGNSRFEALVAKGETHILVTYVPVTDEKDALLKSVQFRVGMGRKLSTAELNTIAKQMNGMGFTQETISQTLGVSQSSVSRWFSEKKFPKKPENIQMDNLEKSIKELRALFNTFKKAEKPDWACLNTKAQDLVTVIAAEASKANTTPATSVASSSASGAGSIAEKAITQALSAKGVSNRTPFQTSVSVAPNRKIVAESGVPA